MTEELKQKAKDFIDRINKESDGMWFNNYYLSDLLVMFATEATKELQEENEKLKKVNNILFEATEKVGKRNNELLGQIEKMKELGNGWHKDLPKEDVSLAIIEVEDCGYLLCEYRKGVWYDNGSSSVCKDWITRNIKRWKEIVLPELKESE